ncbi:glycerophosphodiester phosphodiesterase family protein [Acinetobacter nectaris]|uniref:glycerophosphodiester phosphodiesterase family protein n=1 Tax=Acinetobacter nectaris TaxID=1219382 RepID=UPI001F30D1E5|nr:glycerophosphodiester phosphodiesterase family protein [Acinetobacter nectaris]
MFKQTFAFCISAMIYTAVVASPLVIAHRGGTADAPENTVNTIQQALSNKADIIWITVQLTKDKIPILYRPSNLSSLTDGQGFVSQYNYDQLERLNVAYAFDQQHQVHLSEKIPTLEQVLDHFPNTRFFIDIKSPDANPTEMGQALEQVVTKKHVENKVLFYSTNSAFLDHLPMSLHKFETRDETRSLLTHILLSGGQCPIHRQNNHSKWYGFELRRKVDVVEKFTLGEGHTAAELVWNKAAVKCLRLGGASVVLFGVNNPEDYKLAKKLHADAVMVDSLVDFNHKK